MAQELLANHGDTSPLTPGRQSINDKVLRDDD